MSLTELIQKLEAAKEGSRELDIAILTEVMGFRRVAENLFYGSKPEEWAYTLDGDGHPKLPSPTCSLDAALTLVPDGLSASATKHAGGRGAAEIWRYSPEKFADQVPGLTSEDLRRRNESFTHQNVGAATPALALCIAALKAREAAR